MSTPLFKTKTFAVDGSQKCACIIAGYRGKIASYTRVIDHLNKKGYTVIAYEYSPTVLTIGDPGLLPVLVDQLCSNFAARTALYKEAVCVGASIGAGLCLAIQRQFPIVKFGVYAGTGVSPAQTIYKAPLFYFVRKKFTERGFGKNELQKAWEDMDIRSDESFGKTPFVMALGKRDMIVDYDKAVATLSAWQSQGQPIRIISKAGLGHIGIIRWYKSHFSDLLEIAEKLQP